MAPDTARLLDGLLPEFAARQVTVPMLQAADLVLTMTREQRASVVTLEPGCVRRPYTVREFADLAAIAVERGLGVADPDPGAADGGAGRGGAAAAEPASPRGGRRPAPYGRVPRHTNGRSSSCVARSRSSSTRWVRAPRPDAAAPPTSRCRASRRRPGGRPGTGAPPGPSSPAARGRTLAPRVAAHLTQGRSKDAGGEGRVVGDHPPRPHLVGDLGRRRRDRCEHGAAEGQGQQQRPGVAHLPIGQHDQLRLSDLLGEGGVVDVLEHQPDTVVRGRAGLHLRAVRRAWSAQDVQSRRGSGQSRNVSTSAHSMPLWTSGRGRRTAGGRAPSPGPGTRRTTPGSGRGG